MNIRPITRTTLLRHGCFEWICLGYVGGTRFSSFVQCFHSMCCCRCLRLVYSLLLQNGQRGNPDVLVGTSNPNIVRGFLVRKLLAVTFLNKKPIQLIALVWHMS
jgi:hypothetical protein